METFSTAQAPETGKPTATAAQKTRKTPHLVPKQLFSIKRTPQLILRFFPAIAIGIDCKKGEAFSLPSQVLEGCKNDTSPKSRFGGVL